MRGLKGKRIIVAGAATGIGAATAKRLGEEGVQLLVGDINMEGLQATAAQIESSGGVVKAVHFDLADPQSALALVAACVKQYGGVDGLANIGADLSLAGDLDLLSATDQTWDRQLSCNLLGYTRTVRAVLPHFLAQKKGVIVNTSSMASYLGEDVRFGYAAAKAGVNALTRHVARRWGRDNIRSNCIAPGFVASDKASSNLPAAVQEQVVKAIPLGRPALPADLAPLYAFLLSDDSAWITGQVWTINGGQMFRE
jgi:NAD(P)-dependent dehydrogenase (short-subunit alcohol dehydrogenase family)